jgi:hypothetical protein
MKTQLNETKRMQQLAGILKENFDYKNGFTVKLLKGGKFEISKDREVLSPEEIEALTPKEKDEIARLKKKALNDAQWGDSSSKIKIGDTQAPSSDDEDYWE